jgi:hypothetical protein
VVGLKQLLHCELKCLVHQFLYQILIQPRLLNRLLLGSYIGIIIPGEKVGTEIVLFLLAVVLHGGVTGLVLAYSYAGLRSIFLFSLLLIRTSQIETRQLTLQQGGVPEDDL